MIAKRADRFKAGAALAALALSATLGGCSGRDTDVAEKVAAAEAAANRSEAAAKRAEEAASHSRRQSTQNEVVTEDVEPGPDNQDANAAPQPDLNNQPG